MKRKDGLNVAAVVLLFGYRCGRYGCAGGFG